MACHGRQKLCFAAALGLVVAAADGAEKTATSVRKMLAEPVGVRLEPIGSSIATDDPIALAGLVHVLQNDGNEQHRLAAVEQMLRIPAPSGLARNLLKTVAQHDPSVWVRMAAEQAHARLGQLQSWDLAQPPRRPTNDPWLPADRPVESYRRALFQIWKTHEEATQQFPDGMIAQANQQQPGPTAPTQSTPHAPREAPDHHAERNDYNNGSKPPSPPAVAVAKASIDRPSSSVVPAASSGVKPASLPKYVEQLPPEERQLVAARLAAFKGTPYGRSLLPEIPDAPAARKKLAKQMIAEARGLIAKQQLDDAENILYKLREFAADYGYFEHSPESLERDIAHARARQQGNSIPGVFQKFHR